MGQKIARLKELRQTEIADSNVQKLVRFVPQ